MSAIKDWQMEYEEESMRELLDKIGVKYEELKQQNRILQNKLLEYSTVECPVCHEKIFSKKCLTDSKSCAILCTSNNKGDIHYEP